jgi:hypothetical protein
MFGGAAPGRVLMRIRRLVTLIAPVGVVMGALFFDARSSVARPEYTRKTKKECLFCHPPNSFQLTEAGKYYRDHRSLDGYEPTPKPKESNGL